jgi:hypothetical protein
LHIPRKYYIHPCPTPVKVVTRPRTLTTTDRIATDRIADDDKYQRQRRIADDDEGSPTTTRIATTIDDGSRQRLTTDSDDNEGLTTTKDCRRHRIDRQRRIDDEVSTAKDQRRRIDNETTDRLTTTGRINDDTILTDAPSKVVTRPRTLTKRCLTGLI